MLRYYEDNGELNKVEIKNEEEESTQPLKGNYYYTCDFLNSTNDYDALYFKDKGEYYAFAVLGYEGFKMVSGFNSYDGILDAVLNKDQLLAVSLQQHMLTIYKSTNEYQAESVKLKGTLVF